MANLYISELAKVGSSYGTVAQAAEQPALVNQVVDFTSGAAASAEFNAKTRIVAIVADADCHYVFGETPVADTDDMLLPANQTQYFTIDANNALKVSAIAV